MSWKAVKRTMSDLLSRITTDPAICHGQPALRGLRYRVEDVLEWLSSGMTPEDILRDYPDLEADDIRAALAYAARLCRAARDQGTDLVDAIRGRVDPVGGVELEPVPREPMRDPARLRS